MPSCPKWTLTVILNGQDWPIQPHGLALTLFKLDSHTSIILDLLNHLSAPANDHPDRMPRHWDLRAGGRRRVSWVPALELCCPPLSTGHEEHPHPHLMPSFLGGGLHSHRCPRQSGIHTRSGPQSHPGHAPGEYPSPSHRLAANTQGMGHTASAAAQPHPLTTTESWA